MVLAEFQVGQVLWSMVYFFLIFMWIMLIFQVFGDIIRSRDLSGGAKALWTALIIFLPYLGIFIYLIARGGGMGDRQLQRMQENDDAFRSYVRDATGGSADELARLAELHAAGSLTDDEFAAAKSRVIGAG